MTRHCAGAIFLRNEDNDMRNGLISTAYDSMDKREILAYDYARGLLRENERVVVAFGECGTQVQIVADMGKSTEHTLGMGIDSTFARAYIVALFKAGRLIP